jgi:hypothetical protein
MKKSYAISFLLLKGFSEHKSVDLDSNADARTPLFLLFLCWFSPADFRRAPMHHLQNEISVPKRADCEDGSNGKHC